MQTRLKEEASRDIYDTFEISSGLYTKSAPSISPFLLAVVVGWLAVIFISYSVFAPRNAMVAVAMAASALSVFGALVVIWELARPFDGFLAVSVNRCAPRSLASVGRKHRPDHPPHGSI